MSQVIWAISYIGDSSVNRIIHYCHLEIIETENGRFSRFGIAIEYAKRVFMNFF
jgi:hypothetical protein